MPPSSHNTGSPPLTSRHFSSRGSIVDAFIPAISCFSFRIPLQDPLSSPSSILLAGSYNKFLFSRRVHINILFVCVVRRT